MASMCRTIRRKMKLMELRGVEHRTIRYIPTDQPAQRKTIFGRIRQKIWLLLQGVYKGKGVRS